VLRIALYMPALSAMRYNSAVSIGSRRGGSSKESKIGIAAMRKLLVNSTRRWRFVNDPACRATAWH
jgi:hypothetical protein